MPVFFVSVSNDGLKGGAVLVAQPRNCQPLPLLHFSELRLVGPHFLDCIWMRCDDAVQRFLIEPDFPRLALDRGRCDRRSCIVHGAGFLDTDAVYNGGWFRIRDVNARCRFANGFIKDEIGVAAFRVRFSRPKIEVNKLVGHCKHSEECLIVLAGEKEGKRSQEFSGSNIGGVVTD
ncbi:hypothetical protein LL06_20825 [Hoeflea sp. BAL378]|nr:hypothetical protein LL06_20825 [Hoeflea sp. BAL378]